MKMAMKQLNLTKDIIVQDINKLLEREERIDILVEKTNVMQNLSLGMKRRANLVHRNEKWRYYKIRIFIALAILV
jgi:vesicle-associated membrane protein 7